MALCFLRRRRGAIVRRIKHAAPLVVIAAALLNARLSPAQLPQARLSAVQPSGGQRGTTIELSLSAGVDLDEASQLYFSHPGITAIRKTQIVGGRPEPVTGQFVVTIAPEVPVGTYDIRARGMFGLSNPRSFCVSDQKEAHETEPNNTVQQAMAVEVGTVVNGRSDAAADLDWYKVNLKAGQRLRMMLHSRSIDSRMQGLMELYAGGRRIAHREVHGRQEPLLDFTAPADGEYLLKVHDFVYEGGAEHFYRLAFSTAPHIDFIVPASGVPNTTGEYTLFGRGLPGGEPSGVKASDGLALEKMRVQIAMIADPATLAPGETLGPEEAGVDGIGYRLTSPAGTSNAVTIYFSTTGTLIEAEPNDAGAEPQKVAVPVEITGQFQKRGDIDVYQFEAKKGEVYWVEVFGQRTGSNADPVLAIDQVKQNEKGEEALTRIAALDDNPLNLGATEFKTNTDDPAFRFVVPADGTFRVTVRDRSFESRGDPALVYRLSIRSESPDFRLVALPLLPVAQPPQQANQPLVQGPCELSLRKGESMPMLVMAFRRDSFAGSIDVSADGLPPGVTCTSGTIGSTQNSCRLIFSTAENTAEWQGTIRIVARARLDDPAAAKAVADAEAARNAAVQAIQTTEKPASDAQVALKAAGDRHEAAKAALEKDAANEQLQRALAEAAAAHSKAQAAAESAILARGAAELKLAEAQGALAAARLAVEQSGRELVREARSGTIVWPGNPAAQMAAESRVARSLTLAVLKETAPFQVLTDVHNITVNQGAQILIPIKSIRRGGFEGPVNVTFAQPPQNVQVENKALSREAAEQVFRVFVQNNAPIGKHTLFITGQGQVSYRRHPEAADAAAKVKEAADKLAAEAAEAAKKAAEIKATLEKKATEVAAAVQSAIETKARTDKAAAVAFAAAVTASDVVERAREALAKEPANDVLKGARDSAETAFAKASEDARRAAEEKAAADKAIGDTDANVRKTAEEKAVAEKAVAETEARSKAAAAEKAAADKKAQDTANVAKAQNKGVVSPAASIVLDVRPAMGTLGLEVPNSGAVKRGAQLELKVKLNRAKSFYGPVELSLPLPPGVAGLSAAPVKIAADQTDGKLVIQAAPDATTGQLANMIVRATMQFDGPAAIDQPIAIKVEE